MTRDEIEKRIKSILQISETADLEPPYRELVFGHAFWLSKKVDRLTQFLLSEIDRLKEYESDRTRLACEMSRLRGDHYDDCKKIVELEEKIEVLNEENAQSTKWIHVIGSEMREQRTRIEQGEVRNKALVEGIEKHKVYKEMEYAKWHLDKYVITDIDKELYKLLEE